jgi:hypothetical protein
MSDKDTVIARSKDFLLHNPAKNKCLQIDVESEALLQCGPGGNVTFVKSGQPNPNFKLLKRNPGSVDNPDKNSDPCGPLKPDPEPFKFKKNSQVNDLIVS